MTFSCNQNEKSQVFYRTLSNMWNDQMTRTNRMEDNVRICFLHSQPSQVLAGISQIKRNFSTGKSWKQTSSWELERKRETTVQRKRRQISNRRTNIPTRGDWKFILYTRKKWILFCSYMSNTSTEPETLSLASFEESVLLSIIPWHDTDQSRCLCTSCLSFFFHVFLHVNPL